MKVLEQYEGQAVITRDDVRLEVACEYEVAEDEVQVDVFEWMPGLREWSGSFALKCGTLADLGGEYRLELPDGRSGRIILASLDFADVTEMGASWRSARPTALGTFVGIGPAPGVR